MILALLCGLVGWMLLNVLRGMTFDVATAASGRQPTSASAVVNVESAFGVFAFVYAAGALAGAARRSP
ncbi:sugar ABC transporter permease [Salmonella enterica subsp. enterica]|uniref:Sugar ABC transporter permease n=1 Tax=Salmonella enterica I TaxID=59201 RepID=A0A3S4KE05_SALET|nr:sugar ABC transporter permease [Salmonella enterica subsp. enterica]